MGKSLSKVTCRDCAFYTIRDTGYYDRERHDPYCMERNCWLYDDVPCLDFQKDDTEPEEEDPWYDEI